MNGVTSLEENPEERRGAEKADRQRERMKRVSVAEIYQKRVSRREKINFFKRMLLEESRKENPDSCAIKYYIKEIWRLRRKRPVYMCMNEKA